MGFDKQMHEVSGSTTPRTIEIKFVDAQNMTDDELASIANT